MRRRGTLAAAVTVALVCTAAATTSQATVPTSRAATASVSAATLAGKVTIALTLNRAQIGTFRIVGAISDSGRARARRSVGGNRVRLTLTLEGGKGRIKLLVNQACGRVASRWSVYAGTRVYRALSGGGAGTGRISCGKTAAPHRGTYRGTVRTPPPAAVAVPGAYGGSGHNPNYRMTFDVLPDGRAVTNVAFRQLVVRCQPPAVEFPAPRFTDVYPLTESGQFSITADGYVVTGKINGASARGSIAYEAGACKAPKANWKATNPPPPPPLVSRGRYCGFTLAGSGVCIDASSDGWVTRTRFEVKLRCFQPRPATFVYEYVYEGALAIRPDLTFSGKLSNVPLPYGGSLRFSVTGKFDDANHVSGTGGISRVRIVRNGELYTCRSAVSSFTARLGA